MQSGGYFPNSCESLPSSPERGFLVVLDYAARSPVGQAVPDAIPAFARLARCVRHSLTYWTVQVTLDAQTA